MYYPQSQYRPQQTAYIKGRLVSSFEEVKGTAIDFDGSTFYFPDIANKKIYTKQITQDGTAAYSVYELKSMPTEQNTSPYITREEFEAALAKLRPLAQPQAQVQSQ